MCRPAYAIVQLAKVAGSLKPNRCRYWDGPRYGGAATQLSVEHAAQRRVCMLHITTHNSHQASTCCGGMIAPPPSAAECSRLYTQPPAAALPRTSCHIYSTPASHPRSNPYMLEWANVFHARHLLIPTCKLVSTCKLHHSPVNAGL